MLRRVGGRENVLLRLVRIIRATCLRPARIFLLSLLSACCVLGLSNRGVGRAISRNPFPAQFDDRSLFSTAIVQAEHSSVVPRRLSGITVPHHLLAADLIARAFTRADAGRVDKVILLFPDHFKKSKLPFATTRRAFETVFGEGRGCSEPDVEFLLRSRNLVEEFGLVWK